MSIVFPLIVAPFKTWLSQSAYRLCSSNTDINVLRMCAHVLLIVIRIRNCTKWYHILAILFRAPIAHKDKKYPPNISFYSTPMI